MLMFSDTINSPWKHLDKVLCQTASEMPAPAVLVYHPVPVPASHLAHDP